MDIGIEINQYKIVEHIGRGGMADVWSARDQRLNRMVALKTIAPQLTTEQGDPIALFRREAQTIASMEHPHILPIYDFGDYKGKLYIVMRYMAGGSLGDTLESGPLLAPQVLRFGRAIANALDFAHQNKVVHLDLKPHNILLDTHHSPYLADFGLATLLDPEGRAQNPGSGTLLYMAPEQLVSEVIDYRADLYSFGIMLYHMFTGRMPFDGSQPMALKQLQYQDDLPMLSDYPQGVTDVLRMTVNPNIQSRHPTANALIDDLEAVLSDSFSLSPSELEAEEYQQGQIIISSDADLLEAADIYGRARHAWSAGQGRFLLGVTQYMLMNGYYMEWQRHGLTVDEEGRQMLLRGALEYDQHIGFWWDTLDDSNRRWVCLHALRSGNTPARIRAMYRLETLPDADPPRIPKAIAQALAVETDPQARIAALGVLATRARLLKPTLYEIKTEYRGLMLSSLTRIDVQLTPDAEWSEAVYSPDIDHLIAQMALDHTQPEVADFAARVIGRIRSMGAVRFLAEQQRARSQGALRALALVRDEAPNLPEVVSPLGRLYAWFANTWRRMTDHPLQLTWRFLLAMFGASVAMGYHVFATFRAQAFFTPDRLANTLSFGLTFGLCIAILSFLSEEIPTRLRGFWGTGLRGLWSAVIGVTLATLIWGMVYYLYFRQTEIAWDAMAIAGFGLAIPLLLTTLLRLRGWFAATLTAFGVIVTLYATWLNFCVPTGFCRGLAPFSPAPAPLLGLALGLFVGFVWRVSGEIRPSRAPMLMIGIAVGLGAAIALALWGVQALYYSAFPGLGTGSWLPLIGVAAMSAILGILVTRIWQGAPRIAFAVSSIAVYIALLLSLNPIFQDPVFAPNQEPFNLAYGDNSQLLTVLIPFGVLIALGVHAQLLYQEVRLVLGRRARLTSPATPLKTTTAPILIKDEPIPLKPPIDEQLASVTDLRSALIDSGEDATEAHPYREEPKG